MTTLLKPNDKSQISYFPVKSSELPSLTVQQFLDVVISTGPDMGIQVFNEQTVQDHHQLEELSLLRAADHHDKRSKPPVTSKSGVALYDYATSFLKQATVFHPLNKTDFPHFLEDLARSKHPRITRNMWRVLLGAGLLGEYSIEASRRRVGLSYQATATALKQLHNARILRRVAVPSYSYCYLSPIFVFTRLQTQMKSSYLMSSNMFIGGDGLQSHYFLYPSAQLQALKDRLDEQEEHLILYVTDEGCIRETCSFFLMNPETKRFEASHSILLNAPLSPNRWREGAFNQLFDSRSKLLKTDVQLAYYLSRDLETPNHELAKYLDKTTTYISERKKYNLKRGFLHSRNVFGHIGLDEATWLLLPTDSVTDALTTFFDHLPITKHYNFIEHPSKKALHGVLIQGPIGIMSLVTHFLNYHLNISNYKAYLAPNQNDHYMPRPNLFLEASQSWELDNLRITHQNDSTP